MDAMREGVTMAGCDESYLVRLDQSLADFAQEYVAADDVSPGFDHARCQAAGRRLLDRLVTREGGPGLLKASWRQVVHNQSRWNTPPAHVWNQMRHVRILLVNRHHRLGVRVGIACGAVGKYSVAEVAGYLPCLWRELRKEVREYLEYIGRLPDTAPVASDWIDDDRYRQKRADLLRRLVNTGWSSDTDLLTHLGYGNRPAGPENLRKLIANTNNDLFERRGAGWEIEPERRAGVLGRVLRTSPARQS